MTIAELLEAKVRAAGRAEGIANSIVMVLNAREFHVTEAVRCRIAACTDIEMLDHWLVRAATAFAVDDVFEG